MAYKITDECIACGACAEACPVSAIKEGDTKYEINAQTTLSQVMLMLVHKPHSQQGPLSLTVGNLVCFLIHCHVTFPSNS